MLSRLTFSTSGTAGISTSRWGNTGGRAARTAFARPVKLVQNIVLSMPPPTPPDKVLAAAKVFAREKFGAKHPSRAPLQGLAWRSPSTLTAAWPGRWAWLTSTQRLQALTGTALLVSEWGWYLRNVRYESARQGIGRRHDVLAILGLGQQTAI